MNPSQAVFTLRNVTKRYEIRKGFFSRGKSFAAVRDVSLSLERGRVHGLAGESGSGKTTLARLLAGMISPSSGGIFFENRDLRQVKNDKIRPYSKRVQMIFQNPYLSLDPKWNVGRILSEGLRGISERDRRQRTEKALFEVGLSPDFLNRKPASLSGGERQRVAIARALAVEPEFLILDEPTSQLDVSVQAQVMKLLERLKPLFGGGMLFITHDLALVSDFADELSVMREGRIVEQGPVRQVLSSPRDRYTQRLIEAVPVWKA